MSKRILVTGAGGFVGPYLIRELQKNPENVIYASVYSPTSNIGGLLSADHILPGDLTTFAYAKNLIQICSPDVVYHLASLSRVENSVAETTHLITNNTLLTFNLLEALRELKPQARVVGVCSGNVYGQVLPGELPIKETTPLRPQNAYAVSKISQEYLLLEYHYAHGLDVTILRPFNHTGPGQLDEFVIPSLAKQVVAIKRRDQPPVLKVGNLAAARDFCDVRDMARAYTLAADHCLSGEIYNIGSGRAYTIKETLSLLQTLAKVSLTLEEDATKVRSSDIPVLVADSTKFRAASSWAPEYSFEQTLESVLQYWEGKND